MQIAFWRDSISDFLSLLKRDEALSKMQISSRPTMRLQTGKCVLIKCHAGKKKKKEGEKKPAPPQNQNYMERAHEGNQRMQFDSSDNIPMINQKHLGFCFCLI